MGVRNDHDESVAFARNLRRNMTALEAGLWHRLRRGQIGFRFRRQYPVEPFYVLDFYCPAVKLCIEIDGPQHEEGRDGIRDGNVEQAGILTLRFTSDEVFKEIDSVVERIRFVCVERQPSK